MLVTGPKKDICLVKAVCVLLVPISLLLPTNIYRPGQPLHVIIVGMTSATGLAVIDFITRQRNYIVDKCWRDGALPVVFVLSGIYIAVRSKKPVNPSAKWINTNHLAYSLE
jgi:hypothetical protein